MSIQDKIYYQDEWATIYCGDNREILPELSGIDLVVTSPPYDDLREYGGHRFSFSDMPSLLYKSMVQGAVCVWVVGDQTINGSETGSSFRQALAFMDTGFNLHDTMIYMKRGVAHPSSNRYHQVFEYMFVFSKGTPNTFNPIKDRRNIYDKRGGDAIRLKDGSMKYGKRGGGKLDKYGMRFNVWEYKIGGGLIADNDIVHQHPAAFPESLVNDHIISWSNAGDVVLDPFLGSGTTCYCAKKLNRRSIGIEINEKYCEIAKKRLAQSVMVL